MTDRSDLIHGDEGHSCYDANGDLTCVIGKMLVTSGPNWRELQGDADD